MTYIQAIQADYLIHFLSRLGIKSAKRTRYFWDPDTQKEFVVIV